MRGNSQLVPQREQFVSQKRNRGVKGSGKRRRFDEAGAATGLNKRDALVPAHLILDAKAMVKIEQIGAAAQQHVLAVVHHLARAGMLVGRSTAAEKCSALEERNFVPGIGQRTCGRESGESPADNAYARMLCVRFTLRDRARSQKSLPESFGQDFEFIAQREAHALGIHVVTA